LVGITKGRALLAFEVALKPTLSCRLPL